MAPSHNMSRRDFVTLVTAALGTIMAAVIGLPAIDYLIDPALKAQKSATWIPLGKLASFLLGKPTLSTFTSTKVNGWEQTVDSYGVYVVRQSDTQVLVLSNICTHLGCHVNWKEDRQEYVCPCHDAHFGLTGDVHSGPPPRPLNRYETKVENGILSIHLVEG
ncbi:MAG: ubiquinol-cytochrome c reductase iron-sulfur subunit [Anaerolineales bacterium]|jgi:menaquinol-cytochrome c reductase iron-sulfur subunit